MPTLRIQFPEKDSPSTVVLDAPKITFGRRADNTVQIVDRTISAFHAELIREDDHYRLHDLGSTNGTRVNGEPVTDYHLREACKISFGPVECEFSPEAAPAGGVETLPTRVEIDAVRRENDDLKGRIASLQQETESLRKVTSAGGEEAGANLVQEEMQRLIRERAELQESAEKREREFTSLKTELARMNRDRQNLQDALNQANAEIAHLKNAPEQKVPQVQPSEPIPAEKPALPKPAGLTGLPKPSALTPVGQPAQTPSTPAATPRPVSRPAVAAPPLKAPTPRVVAHPAAGARAVASSPSTAGPSGTQKISVPSQFQSGASIGKPLPRPLPRPLGAVPAAAAEEGRGEGSRQ